MNDDPHPQSSALQGENDPLSAGSPVPVFCNAASGQSNTEDRLRAAAASAGIAIDLRRLPPGALGPAIAAAVAARAPVIAVAGGDGSVSTAARLTVGTSTVLAVFPAGTMNHFAVALGIHDHEGAARALAMGLVTAVDVGEVNGRVFVNGVSFGLYPRTLELRRRWEPRFGKRAAALFAALRAIADFPRGPLWQHDPADPTARYPLAWVGPGRGSFRPPRINPRELDSGTLELVVVDTWSKIDLLRLAGRTLRRRLDALSVCADFPSSSVQYVTEFDPPGPHADWIDAGIDGELVRLHPPLHFRVRSRALRVISARPEGERQARR